MVSFIEQLAAGNALRVFVQRPPGARRCRVLRSTASSIPSFDFSGAAVVLDAAGETSFLDTDPALLNGAPVWYRAFYLMTDGTWLATAPKSATPACSFVDRTSDAMDVLRARLDAGFKALVARGDIKPQAGFIPVLTASPQFEGTRFPVVTVHLGQDGPGERGVGEELGGEDDDDEGVYLSEGWLSRVSITIMVWSLNVDERKLMRRQLKALLMANLAVFDDAGLVQVDMTFSDQDDFTSYPAPVYQVVGAFSCLAPSSVATLVPVVADIKVSIQGE